MLTYGCWLECTGLHCRLPLLVNFRRTTVTEPVRWVSIGSADIVQFGGCGGSSSSLLKFIEKPARP